MLADDLAHKLEIPRDAARYLADIYDAFQLFDDVADGDHVNRHDLDRVIWSCLVNDNPFYHAHAAVLNHAVSLQIAKWQASDCAERNGRADAKSFVWRAGFFDLVLLVVIICHGKSAAQYAAESVLRLYGETFEDYMEEFANA